MNTCISPFMQKESCRSCLWGGDIVMTLVCLFCSANFLILRRPIFDSFLLISLAPPHMITNSSCCSWLVSLLAKPVICLSPVPGIIVLITSKLFPSDAESSAAKPLAWLSPITITFLFFIFVLITQFPVVSLRDRLLAIFLTPFADTAVVPSLLVST